MTLKNLKKTVCLTINKANTNERTHQVGRDIANKELNRLAEEMLSRHMKMAVLVLYELGWGKKRLIQFIEAFNKQIKRMGQYDHDLGDFDYKINSEIAKLGIDYEI